MDRLPVVLGPRARITIQVTDRAGAAAAGSR
jgi:hypothetical protein